MKKRTKIIVVILFAVIVALGIATGIYANDYYRAVDVEEYIKSGNGVTVTQIDEGYFFDGPGEDKALIFYPGAKVEETAYAPIMKSLAEQGIDCFLIKMPIKLAILGANKADKSVRNMITIITISQVTRSAELWQRIMPQSTLTIIRDYSCLPLILQRI